VFKLDSNELAKIILKKQAELDKLKAVLVAHRLYDAIEELED